MSEQGPDQPQPGGTVYGRGGVDVRAPRQGLLTRVHPAATAAVCAGIIAVLGLGYGIWRATGDSPEPAAATPPPPPPSAVPSSSSPARLAPGSWLLSPRDEAGTYLTSDNGFAALSAREQLELHVVPGLADGACFTFRLDDGRHLRHFDYRLRFDAVEDSDLFRNDATFCPEPGQPAGTVRLASKNYPDHVIHRRGAELYIDKPDGSDGFAADSTFAVEPA